MAKRTIISTGVGKLAIFFLITGIVGMIFQFILLYLPLIKAGGGVSYIIISFILHIVALAFGILAIIFSLVKVHKLLWIISCFLVVVFTFAPPIVYAVRGGVNLPYFDLVFTQIGYYLTLPTNPLLDFIGFYMATGGALLASIIGFTIPKK